MRENNIISAFRIKINIDILIGKCRIKTSHYLYLNKFEETSNVVVEINHNNVTIFTMLFLWKNRLQVTKTVTGTS